MKKASFSLGVRLSTSCDFSLWLRLSFFPYRVRVLKTDVFFFCISAVVDFGFESVSLILASNRKQITSYSAAGANQTIACKIPGVISLV